MSTKDVGIFDIVELSDKITILSNVVLRQEFHSSRINVASSNHVHWTSVFHFLPNCHAVLLCFDDFHERHWDWLALSEPRDS